MKTTYTALAVLAAGAELASASFFDSSKFSCPSNTNNECNSQQSTGFNWQTLDIGSFQNYGDFSFSGWSCAGSFGSGKKRDVVTGRSFQDKCITGQASHDQSSSPSFGCGSSTSVNDFSVTEFEVSVEFDCELEFHFEMPDKSTCKQKSKCATGGSVVKNSQCGGAKSVTVIYPTQTSGTGTTKTACSLGVHSMSFDCNSASSTVVYSTKSTSVATTPATTLATTTSVPVTKSSVVIKSSSSAVSSPSSVSIPETTSTSAVIESTYTGSVPETTPVASVPETTPVLSTSSTLGFFNSSSSVVVPSSSAPEVSSSVVLTTSSAIGTPSSAVETTPAPSTAVETTSAPITSPTSVDVVTVIVSTSTTVCPVTLTHVTGGTTSTIATTISHVTEGTTSLETTSVPYVTGGTTSIEIGTTTSTILSTVTSTICTKCSAASVSSTTTASGPVETAPCPAVLPSCLNTWLFSEGCSSNTDSACYCPSEAFVKNVFDCLSAHAADDDEIAEAQTYFQGICAAHIPENPAIVTGATTALTTTAAPTASSVPVTTIQVYTTLTVPCVESTGISSGSVIPSSSTVTILSTYLTVPQVIFTTVTGSTTVSADLVAGTPASVVATTTPAEVYSTIPIPTGTLSVSKTAAGNISATATPSSVVSTGSGAQNTFTFGASFAALIVAVMAL